MSRALGAVLGVIVSLIGLAALAIVVAVVLFNSGALNGMIEEQITAQAGQPARLEADPSLGFEDGNLTLELGPISVANADWAAAQYPELARIEQVRASVRLWPLLRGRVELPQILVDQPQIHLARAEDGRTNWPEPDIDAPDDGPTWLPEVENLELRGAAVTYADAAAGTDIDLTLAEATTSFGGGRDFALQANGSLQEAPLRLEATGGPLTAFFNGDPEAEPVEFDLTLDQSRIDGRATSFDDLDQLEANLHVTAEPALADLLARMGIAEADLPPFEANLQVEPGQGGSTVVGDVTLEGASLRIDGLVDDLSVPMEGFAATFELDAPGLGPLLGRFDIAYADQVPSAQAKAEITHRDDNTTVAANGSIGGDDLDLQASYQGAITDFRNPSIELHLEGAALGVLPAELGLATRPIEHYRIDAKVEERSGEANPVQLDVAIEDTRIRFDGSIDELRAFKGVEGQGQVQGPNPAALLELFELPAISLPPYDFAGQVTWRGDRIEIAGLDGTFGDSDARGEVTIDLGQTPVAVAAELQSDRLVMDDLAGVIGGPVDPEAKEQQEGKLLPTGKIDPEAWKNLNVDVRYTTARIESTYLPIDRIEAHLVSREGWLTLDPVRTGLADGAITLFASLDGTQDPVAGEFDVRMASLQLQDMLTKLGVTGEGFGELDGRIRLEGHGRSIDELLASADGQIGLTMTGGSIDSLILEAIGLDIAESLLVLFDSADQAEEDKVPIRCAIANIEVAQGVATAQPIVIDTTDSKITVDGTIDLRDETLDVLVQSHPKDASLLSANQPIHVDGPILSPSVNPAPGETENEALGWLLAPLAALVPFFDLGGEEDSPCGALVAQAKEAAAARPK